MISSGNNKYIGARYVPIIMGEWDSTIKYEPLMVILYQGTSYTSKTSVPAGVLPTVTNYWVKTGDYNAQVEQYRQEVENYVTKQREIVCSNVQDMISKGSTLHDGDIVKTKGYYTENDGGSSTYVISDEEQTEDGGGVIKINNTLYAYLIFNESVTVKQFGCYGDDLHDDAPFFKKAILFSSSKKIELKVNIDLYIGETITLENFTNISGTDLGRKIYIKSGATVDSLILVNKALWYGRLENITLSGNKANAVGSGIKFLMPTNAGIATCKFNNIYIENFSDFGIYVDNKTLTLFLNNVFISNCGGCGICFLGHDSILNNIEVSGCGITKHEEGAILGGTLTKFSNISVYLSGDYTNSKAGIKVTGILSQYTNIEAQENYYAGLYFTQCYQLQVNCVSDRNNYGNNPNTFGVILNDGNENKIMITCKNNTNAGAIYQQTGVLIAGNNFKNNDLDVTVSDFHTTKMSDLSTTEYNNILLDRVNLKDYYHNITPAKTITLPVTTSGITVSDLGNGSLHVKGTATADVTHWIYGNWGGATGFTVPANHKVIFACGSKLTPLTVADMSVVANGTNVIASGMKQNYNYFGSDTLITGISIKVLNGNTVDFVINPKVLVYQL